MTLPTRHNWRIYSRFGCTMLEDFQAAAGRQGRQFTEVCNGLLRDSGFELHGARRLTHIGVEIDQEAVTPGGKRVWFEYKGSVQGARPGLLRTDTLKKALANGALLRALDEAAPFVVLTSHKPTRGAGRAMLETALRLGYFHAVLCVYDVSDTTVLKQL